MTVLGCAMKVPSCALLLRAVKLNIQCVLFLTINVFTYGYVQTPCVACSTPVCMCVESNSFTPYERTVRNVKVSALKMGSRSQHEQQLHVATDV